MRVVFDQSGSQVMSAGEYDIATTTVANPDQMVKLSSNKVIPVVAGETALILGVPAEPHGGSADAFNPRANGTKIKVFDSAQAVYEAPALVLTATSGSTTTFVDSTVSGFADSDFVGGFMKLITKGASSTITDPVGSVYPITGSTTATGTFTTTTTITGGVTAGDKFAIFPPRGLQKGNFNATFTNLVYTAVATLPIKVQGHDLERNMVRYEAALHQHGNKNA